MTYISWFSDIAIYLEDYLMYKAVTLARGILEPLLTCSSFIWHGGIWKLLDTNDHQDKTVCSVQEPWCYIKGQVHTYSLCIGLNETYLCPAHDFVAGPASGMVWYKDLVFHPFVLSHQAAVLLKALGGGISVLWTHFFSSFKKIMKYCLAYLQNFSYKIVFIAIWMQS